MLVIIKKNIFVYYVLVTLLYFSCTSNRQNLNISVRGKGSLFDDEESLDKILDRYVENGSFPFLYARLEHLDGSVLYEHSSINTELLPNTIVHRGTWIRIWSMSKIITISLAMDLVEDGILDLNDPVTKYIPEFNNLRVAVDDNGTSLAMRDDQSSSCPFQLETVESVMTISHLINHLSGFYYATTKITCLNEILSDQNLPTALNSQELIDRFAALPLIQHPGEKSFYGTNTTVLGLVAERATGKSLDSLIRERLTQFLGIEGLKYNLSDNESLLPRFTGKDTVLRIARDGELNIFGPDVPSNSTDNNVFLGGEGMIATADGYADFLRMLLNRGQLNGKRFLLENTVDEITSPHTQLDNPWGYNGYNLWVTGDSLKIKGWGDTGLWQGGGYEGTQFWIDPKRKFVGVIMSQIHSVPNNGWEYYNEFRGELYNQIFKNE